MYNMVNKNAPVLSPFGDNPNASTFQDLVFSKTRLHIGYAKALWCILILPIVLISSHQIDNRYPDQELKSFDYWRFRMNVNKAIESVKTVLDSARNPQLAEDVPHMYQDKFSLTEFVTNTAIASYRVAFEALGLSQHSLETMLDWTHRLGSPVTLRFEATVTCDYVGEEDVKVVVAEHEVETKSSYFPVLTEMTKVKRTVKQYTWHVKLSYNVSAFNNLHEKVVLEGGQSTRTILTPAKTSPLDNLRSLDRVFDCPLTWWLQSMSPTDGRSTKFSIDRLDQRCKTPRRNYDVEQAIQFDRELCSWASRVYHFFTSTIDATIQGRHDPVAGDGDPPSRLDTTIGESIPSPIIPLLDNGTTLAKDTELLLGEQARSLRDTLAKVSKSLDPSNATYQEGLITAKEASIILIARHIRKLSQEHADAVESVEHMLQQQLITAIGKYVHLRDFDEFMKVHYKTFLAPRFLYEPLARPIRQPNHYPDGVLSVESASEASQNVMTLVRRISGEQSPPIKLPINAATSLEISGDRYLHGWIQHQMMSGSPSSYRIAARTRQFSSFLLILGTMTSPSEFTPKNAILLRNKDEILIPLLTEILPSAKAFGDAIQSLSPEQQGFARAFRAMQLQSSVFGVCVVQLKPQLERLLNLPAGALTKEIELTEDLVTLFVEYQVPSDMLSYDENDKCSNASATAKLDAVKGHVANILKVIQAKKQLQLEDERLKTDMRAEKAFSRALDEVTVSAAAETKRSSRRSLLPEVPNLGGHGRFVTQLSARSASSGDVPLESTADYVHDEFEDYQDLSSIIDEQSRTEDTTEQLFANEERDSVQRRMRLDDFTLLPKTLDLYLEKYDLSGSLRSVILRASDQWTMRTQETLLSPMTSKTLDRHDIEIENKKAYDLLDAISRSGTLSIASSELHVFVAVSHCFDKSIMDTIIQDNSNPILEVEKSMLLLATTVHATSPKDLIGHNTKTLQRLQAAIPSLFRDFLATTDTAID